MTIGENHAKDRTANQNAHRAAEGCVSRPRRRATISAAIGSARKATRLAIRWIWPLWPEPPSAQLCWGS